jgi:hypothetical protein
VRALTFVVTIVLLSTTWTRCLGFTGLSGGKDSGPSGWEAARTAEKMMAWKVDRKVGNVKNDTPDLIEPASNVGTI